MVILFGLRCGGSCDIMKSDNREEGRRGKSKTALEDRNINKENADERKSR